MFSYLYTFLRSLWLTFPLDWKVFRACPGSGGRNRGFALPPCHPPQKLPLHHLFNDVCAAVRSGAPKGTTILHCLWVRDPTTKSHRFISLPFYFVSLILLPACGSSAIGRKHRSPDSPLQPDRGFVLFRSLLNIPLYHIDPFYLLC